MFKRWCHENGLNNASNLSHVLMNGGKLSIPDDRLKEFYEVYCDAVASGEKLYVVEQKSTLYNFFVDMDYKSTEALDLPEVESIVKVVCNKVKAHGGKDALVCLAPPKDVGDGKIKTGIHVNFHGFVVDQRSAVALRQHLLIALYTAKPSVEWSDVVDASVYGDVSRGSKGSGFRMPWSLKRTRCDACGGKGCSTCSNDGRIDQVAYLPVYIYRHGPLSMLQRIEQTPDPAILEMSAVRSSATTHANVQPPNAVFREGAFTRQETKDEFTDDVAIGQLEAFVQKYADGQASARLTKAYRQKNGNLIVATTSKYCENIARDHGGNHVWFLVNDACVMQKCFCRCETLVGRQFGFCKDFTGKEYKLTSDLKKALFSGGDETTTTTTTTKKKPSPPKSNFSDVKLELETFIRKYFSGHEDTKIVEVCKKGGRVLIATNSTSCACEKFVSFAVDKSGMIQRVCGCKERKQMRLFASTVDKLKKK